MVRPLFYQPNRRFLVHLLCVLQLTFSSFMCLLYVFLNYLEEELGVPYNESRQELKWCVISVSAVDFAVGSVLSYGINQIKNYGRRGKILLYIYLDTVLVPISLYFLVQFRFIFVNVEHEALKETYLQINLAHVIYVTSHFVILFLVINFMAYHVDKVKRYDPAIRPSFVYEPTHPSITTTESRHVRFSSSIIMK